MEHVAQSDWRDFSCASALLRFPADWVFNSVQETLTWSWLPLARCDGYGGDAGHEKRQEFQRERQLWGERLNEAQDTSWVFRMLSPPPPPNQRNDY